MIIFGSVISTADQTVVAGSSSGVCPGISNWHTGASRKLHTCCMMRLREGSTLPVLPIAPVRASQPHRVGPKAANDMPQLCSGRGIQSVACINCLY